MHLHFSVKFFNFLWIIDDDNDLLKSINIPNNFLDNNKIKTDSFTIDLNSQAKTYNDFLSLLVWFVRIRRR